MKNKTRGLWTILSTCKALCGPKLRRKVVLDPRSPEIYQESTDPALLKDFAR